MHGVTRIPQGPTADSLAPVADDAWLLEATVIGPPALAEVCLFFFTEGV